MNIEQHTTCYGCRANRRMRYTSVCSLGYRCEIEWESSKRRVKQVPSEPCPKPVTYADMVWAKEFYTKEKKDA